MRGATRRASACARLRVHATKLNTMKTHIVSSSTSTKVAYRPWVIAEELRGTFCPRQLNLRAGEDLAQEAIPARNALTVGEELVVRRACVPAETVQARRVGLPTPDRFGQRRGIIRCKTCAAVTRPQQL